MVSLSEVLFGLLGIAAGLIGAGFAAELRYLKRVDYIRDMERATEDRREIKEDLYNYRRELGDKIDEQADLLHRIAGHLGMNGIKSKKD